jgi:alkyl hydroperoxide reductase subunit D
MHETIQELLADLGIQPEYTNATLQNLGNADSKYLRDLKLNVKAVLNIRTFICKRNKFAGFGGIH